MEFLAEYPQEIPLPAPEFLNDEYSKRFKGAEPPKKEPLEEKGYHYLPRSKTDETI